MSVLSWLTEPRCQAQTRRRSQCQNRATCKVYEDRTLPSNHVGPPTKFCCDAHWDMLVHNPGTGGKRRLEWYE